MIEAIKAYRLTQGLSQKKMAKSLGIDEGTLRRWEKGTAKPSRKLLDQVTKFRGKELSR